MSSHDSQKLAYMLSLSVCCVLLGCQLCAVGGRLCFLVAAHVCCMVKTVHWRAMHGSTEQHLLCDIRWQAV